MLSFVASIIMSESKYFTRSKLKDIGKDTYHKSSGLTGRCRIRRLAKKTTEPVEIQTKKRKHLTVKYESDNDESFTTFIKTEPGTEDRKPKLGAEDWDRLHGKAVGWEPPNWRQQLQHIKEMREERDAPVDTMGCDVISDHTATPQVFTDCK